MHRLNASTRRVRKPMPTRLARLLADPAVWKLTIMTSALTAIERQRYREAFADFAARRGLQVHFSMGTTCIAPTDAPISGEDRGAVMGWLCSRPEVHFIHVQRRGSTQRPASIALQRVQSLEAADVPLQPLFNEEDRSQDPDDNSAFEELRHGR